MVMIKSIPERARELRTTLDNNGIPTVYSPPEKRSRGLSHYLYIYTPNGDRFLVMIEKGRYAIFEKEGDGSNEIHKEDLTGAMEVIRRIYREQAKSE